jgi:hypothetical protein
MPSRAVLEQMTEAIMLDIRDLLAGLRDEEPPPTLFTRPGHSAVGDAG